MFSRSVSRRGSLLGFFAGAAAGPFASGSYAAPASSCGLVVLTVGGLVGASNRPSFDAKRDRFFYHNNLDFKRAHAFTFADLLAFPQQTVMLAEEGGETVFKGPFLGEVLAAANPPGEARTARLSALDGYASEMTIETAKLESWVLAVEADGKAFGIGDLGPLYAVRPLPAGQRRTDEEDARWVFSLYYIELMP